MDDAMNLEELDAWLVMKFLAHAHSILWRIPELKIDGLGVCCTHGQTWSSLAKRLMRRFGKISEKRYSKILTILMPPRACVGRSGAAVENRGLNQSIWCGDYMPS